MISKHAANLALNTLLNEAYIGLHKEDGNEVGTSSYTRKRIFFKAAENGESANIGTVDFGIAAEDWGIISEIGLYDNSGNLLISKELDYKKEVRMTDNYIVNSTSIIINFKNLI